MIFFHRRIVAFALLFTQIAFAQIEITDEEIGFASAHICQNDFLVFPQALQSARDDDAWRVQADRIETQPQQILFSGDVQITSRGRGVFADEVRYDRARESLDARGDIRLYLPGGEIRAPRMQLNADFTGVIEDARIRWANVAPLGLRDDADELFDASNVGAQAQTARANQTDAPVRARAVADTIEIRSQDVEVLHAAAFTTCPAGNNDVQLIAREIRLDHAKGEGRATHARVKFMGASIFYLPTLTFPIGDARKTGFLFPAFGYEEQSGAILEIPYYLNLAPHHDATLTPTWLTKRGAQLYAEYRRLGRNSRSQWRGEYIDSDKQFDSKSRYAWGFKHDRRLGEWRFDANVQDVSDANYLRDFSNDVKIAASSFAPQRANLAYQDSRIRFDARALDYAIINDDLPEASEPYRILPRLSFDIKPQTLRARAFDWQWGLESELTRFRHPAEFKVIGERLRATPWLGAAWRKPYAYLTPKLSLHHIAYQLSRTETPSDDSPAMSLPVASLDAGIYLDRESRDKKYVQSLEPRVFYLRAPKKLEQETFPNFDSGEGGGASFAHFFRRNRFFGGDRVGDANQITLGLSGVITERASGRQLAKLSVGQVHYLRDREVDLDASEKTFEDTRKRSDILTQLSANFGARWRASAFSRWDTQHDELAALRATADYRRNERAQASLAYTRSGEIRQFNAGVQAPLAARWQLQVNAAYSLHDNELRQAAFGLSYDGCCWAVKLSGRRYLVGADEEKTRILLTLELDELGRLRSGL